MIPGAAAGSTTVLIARRRVAPSASAAWRTSCGIWRNASSVAVMTTGSVMQVRVSAAAVIERPMPASSTNAASPNRP